MADAPDEPVAPAVEVAGEVRVAYADVDPMGVAYYGNYLRWFEVGRAELLRRRGKPYRQVEAEGHKLPIIEAYVRYRRPARYDDLLLVQTRGALVGGARLRFDYRVERAGEQGTVLAEGHTVHACLDAADRPVRIPEALRSLVPG